MSGTAVSSSGVKPWAGNSLNESEKKGYDKLSTTGDESVGSHLYSKLLSKHVTPETADKVDQLRARAQAHSVIGANAKKALVRPASAGKRQGRPPSSVAKPRRPQSAGSVRSKRGGGRRVMATPSILQDDSYLPKAGNPDPSAYSGAIVDTFIVRAHEKKRTGVALRLKSNQRPNSARKPDGPPIHAYDVLSALDHSSQRPRSAPGARFSKLPSSTNALAHQNALAAGLGKKYEAVSLERSKGESNWKKGFTIGRPPVTRPRGGRAQTIRSYDPLTQEWSTAVVGDGSDGGDKGPGVVFKASSTWDNLTGITIA